MKSALVCAGCLAAMVTAAGCGSSPSKAVSVKATPAARAAAASVELPALPGMATITDGNRQVGYVPMDELKPPTIEAAKKVTARTLLRVTDADGGLVGYMAPDLPFISLAEANAPGFDVEAARAKKFGGCEPQVGNPDFKQAYPLCPDSDGGA